MKSIYKTFSNFTVKKALFATFAFAFISVNAEAYPSNINSYGSDERIAANTGAVFTRDTSNPKLGEAYRDPSGLIWGSVIPGSMTQYDAYKACKEQNAHLPTSEEFQSLGTYLGRESAKGYSPYTADGSTEVLPGLSKLSNHWIWSSSVNPYSSISASYVFDGLSGNIADDSRYSSYPFRCVSGR